MMYRYQKTLMVLLTIALVGLGAVYGGVRVTEAAVGLTSFDVVRGSSPTTLIVQWETESETNMVAFRVKRSTTSNVQSATEMRVVPRGGTATTGASYSEIDTGLTPGQTYYYWLYEISSDNTEKLLTELPESEAPGDTNSPTNTPTTTPTTVPTQPQSTSTPTSTTQSTATRQPTNTPTIFVVINPSSTPTTPSAGATPTSTFLPQATNTPDRQVSTPQATNTPSTVQPDQPTSTPTLSVPTVIVEGITPSVEVVTPEVAVAATAGADLQGVATPTDQALQVPPTPTQSLAAAPAAAPSTETPLTAIDDDVTPQAIAVQETEVPGALSTERLARPTATPRPSGETESDGSTGSLLLVFGGASLCGAVALALAALVIWRRR